MFVRPFATMWVLLLVPISLSTFLRIGFESPSAENGMLLELLEGACCNINRGRDRYLGRNWRVGKIITTNIRVRQYFVRRRGMDQGSWARSGEIEKNVEWKKKKWKKSKKQRRLYVGRPKRTSPPLKRKQDSLSASPQRSLAWPNIVCRTLLPLDIQPFQAG